jgi:hypothetical protein
MPEIMTTNQQKRTRERILASITQDPESGCWLWVRQVSNSGYGRITLSNQDGTYIESAHRASYRAFTGPLPEHGMIRQTCGNRLCVNPDHLEPLTEQK